MTSAFIGAIGSGLAVATFVCVLFWKAEELVSDDVKAAIYHGLLDFSVAKIAHAWPTYFFRMFTAVFGVRYLGFRAFYSSILFSILYILVLNIVSTIIFGQYANIIYVLYYTMTSVGGTGLVLQVFVENTAVSLFMDFIAISKVRAILSLMSETNSNGLRMFLITIDALTNVLIFYLCFLVIIAIFDYNLQPHVPQLIIFYTTVFVYDYATLEFRLTHGITDFLGSVQFYSVFMASIWLWSYMGSVLILRVSRILDTPVRISLIVFKAEEHPVRVLGVIGGAFIGISIAVIIMLIAVAKG